MADWLSIFLVAVCGIPAAYLLLQTVLALLDRATYTVLNAAKEEED